MHEYITMCFSAVVVVVVIVVVVVVHLFIHKNPILNKLLFFTSIIKN